MAASSLTPSPYAPPSDQHVRAWTRSGAQVLCHGIGFRALEQAEFDRALLDQIADMTDNWNDKLGIRYKRTELVRWGQCGTPRRIRPPLSSVRTTEIIGLGDGGGQTGRSKIRSWRLLRPHAGSATSRS